MAQAQNIDTGAGASRLVNWLVTARPVSSLLLVPSASEVLPWAPVGRGFDALTSGCALHCALPRYPPALLSFTSGVLLSQAELEEARDICAAAGAWLVVDET